MNAPKPVLCDDCIPIHEEDCNPTVELCPLHAAAGEMREENRRLLEAVDRLDDLLLDARGIVFSKAREDDGEEHRHPACSTADRLVRRIDAARAALERADRGKGE